MTAGLLPRPPGRGRTRVFDIYHSKTEGDLIRDPNYFKGVAPIYRLKVTPKIHRIGEPIRGLDWYQYCCQSLTTGRTFIHEQQFNSWREFREAMCLWNRDHRWKYWEIVV